MPASTGPPVGPRHHRPPGVISAGFAVGRVLQLPWVLRKRVTGIRDSSCSLLLVACYLFDLLRLSPRLLYLLTCAGRELVRSDCEDNRQVALAQDFYRSPCLDEARLLQGFQRHIGVCRKTGQARN